MKKHTLLKTISIVSIILTLSATTVAYADSSGAGYSTYSKVESLYRTIIRPIGIALGAVGLAGSAVQIAAGDTNTAAKAKARIIVILLAVMGMVVLPSVINAGINALSSLQWTPPSG